MSDHSISRFSDRADKAEKEIQELTRIFGNLEKCKPEPNLAALQEENRVLREKLCALESKTDGKFIIEFSCFQNLRFPPTCIDIDIVKKT